MLLAILQRTRPFARLLALLLVVGTALPTALHAGWDDDPLCEPALAGSGVAMAIGAASPEGQAQHCDICHWLRSLRSLDAAPAGSVTILQQSAHALGDTSVAPAAAAAASLEARAPPA